MITFTQYLRPNGRTQIVEISLAPEIEAIAQELISKGCRFEIEELMTGMVSMTVEHRDWTKDNQGPVAIKICPNGPEVPKTTVDLIITAKKYFDLGPPPIGI